MAGSAGASPIPYLEPDLCGTEAEPLLTIVTTECGGESWIPEEDEAHPSQLLPGTRPGHFTRLEVARDYDLQLHTCPASPNHPHIERIQ